MPEDQDLYKKDEDVRTTIVAWAILFVLCVFTIVVIADIVDSYIIPLLR